ncbi:MAG: DMT family transporter [Pseudomonadota bacterium]
MHFGLGEFYSVACAFAWAVAVILFKKSGESLGPFALNLFKNVSVLPLFALTLLVLQGTALPQILLDDLALILISGVLGIAAGDTYYFRALNAIGASRIAVAQTLYSPFVIGLSMLFLGERLSGWQFGGVGLVLGGILLVTWSRVGNGDDPRALLRGVGHAVLAMLLMAAGVVMAKPLLERYDFVWVVFLRIVGGSVGMLAIVVWRRQGAALIAEYRAVRHWPQIVAGGLTGTYFSMLLWLAGYKYTQASIAAVLNELAAVFILLLAVIFLREKVGARQIGGVALALAGVFLVVLR